MSLDEEIRSLSLDYLNLLINGQAFSDVTFSVEGRLVHAHKCILASRSLFFKKFFYGQTNQINSGLDLYPNPMGPTTFPRSSGGNNGGPIIQVNTVGYEVFMLLLQFLYSGNVSIVPQKYDEGRVPNCSERGCWHTHCSSAVDLALHTLSAARSFGVEQLLLFTQKHLANMVEKASIEDVMKVLIASRKQEIHQLWTTCSHLVAKSGLPSEILAKHLPIDVIAKVEELRLKSSMTCHQHHHHELGIQATIGHHEDHKILRMRRALDSSDVELVKLMVMGEGLNLDEALALHYAVENCSREVVKTLLELGAADVNYPAGLARKTPLHVAAEMVSPDMVAVLLDHHADPNIRTVDGVTPLEILRTLTSDFLFKGVIPRLAHVEPNKLRLCLELVQSAAMVISREEGNAIVAISTTTAAKYPTINTGGGADHQDPANNTSTSTSSSGNVGNIGIDSRMVYLNLGVMGSTPLGDQMVEDGGQPSQRNPSMSIYHHHNHHPKY